MNSLAILCQGFMLPKELSSLQFSATHAELISLILWLHLFCFATELRETSQLEISFVGTKFTAFGTPIS